MEPSVRLSKRVTVFPTPFIAIGKSNVFPLVLIVWELVLPKVIVLADAVKVIPVEVSKFPYTVTALVAFQVPANPVKFTFFAVYPEVPKKVNAYVPAVKLKLTEFASDKGPVLTVMAPAVEFVTFTTGVPVTVKLVAVAVVQAVPDVRTAVIFPVPKAIVLALVPEELTPATVRVLVPNDSVPEVKNKLAVAVQLSTKDRVPEILSIVRLPPNATPFEVMD